MLLECVRHVMKAVVEDEVEAVLGLGQGPFLGRLDFQGCIRLDLDLPFLISSSHCIEWQAFGIGKH